MGSNTQAIVERFPVGVYGTLRSGHWNHRLLAGATSEGLATLEGYDMYVMSSSTFDAIPFIVKASDDTHTVVVEIFSVTDEDYDEQVQCLDWLEQHPDWYTRTKVTVKGNSVWVYIFEPAVAEHYLGEGSMRVPTGDWCNPEGDIK